MREIKFRGKQTDNGELAYGAFVPDATEPTHGDMVTWGFIRLYNKDLGKMESIEVDRETVGQFTGLHDKNGVEIYEGDILIKPSYLINTYDYRNVCVCKRVERGGVIGLALCDKDVSGEYDNVISSDEWEDFEVIGNIHDNPDLLEVEK